MPCTRNLFNFFTTSTGILAGPGKNVYVDCLQISFLCAAHWIPGSSLSQAQQGRQLAPSQKVSERLQSTERTVAIIRPDISLES